MEMDVKLNFENHINKLFKKANMQLNAFIRIQKYFGPKKEK